MASLTHHTVSVAIITESKQILDSFHNETNKANFDSYVIFELEKGKIIAYSIQKVDFTYLPYFRSKPVLSDQAFGKGKFSMENSQSCYEARFSELNFLNKDVL